MEFAEYEYDWWNDDCPGVPEVDDGRIGPLTFIWIGGTAWFKVFTGGGGTAIFVGGNTGGNDVFPCENVEEYDG